MSKVYFVTGFDDKAIKTVFSAALNELKEFDKGKIALKVHFGEQGNTRFVKPEQIKVIAKQLGSELFLTDTNTLYRGSRLRKKDHLKLAEDHGFKKLELPIVIADGDAGEDDVSVQIDKPLFEAVNIARAIAEADSMVVISHFKGHILFGFGGAIKNLGMGCGSRAGKLAMHSKITPYVNDNCIACNECVENCPADAISTVSGKADIEESKCIGCAKCIAVCPHEAMSVPWHGASSEEAQERCAEHAFGAALGKKIVYITFINNLSKDCDCLRDSKIIGKDIGIVASTDPVACDQATIDLIKKKHGSDIFKEATGVDGAQILPYSEKIGLGKQSYKLIHCNS